MAKVAMESSADPAAQPDTVANKENEPGVCVRVCVCVCVCFV